MGSVLPYLLLVTFAGPHWQQLDDIAIERINSLPYDGVAIAIMSAYSTDAVPSAIELEPVIERVREGAKKHVWPWIFVNRIIGQSETAWAHASARRRAYFQRIRVIDIFDEAGALSDFYALWRLGLQLAKEGGAPGIVVDWEAYNDYRSSSPLHIATKLNISVDSVIEQLRTIGAQLADITASVYPSAKIWCLFTGLSAPNRYTIGAGRGCFMTASYIVLGMLERARARDLKFSIISGGEMSLGYYSRSLSELRRKISIRRRVMKGLLQKYNRWLALGGTIAPFSNPDKLTDWLRRAVGSHPPYRSLEDFEPLFAELFRSYDYVWVYAAGAANYRPFDERVARDFHPTLRRIFMKLRRR